MSRYADLWPRVPNWVEYLATDAFGRVFGFDGKPTAATEWGCWSSGVLYHYATTHPVPFLDWRNSIERRPPR
jgi:hypothetical protein